jgi:hypothetical protein
LLVASRRTCLRGTANSAAFLRPTFTSPRMRGRGTQRTSPAAAQNITPPHVPERLAPEATAVHLALPEQDGETRGGLAYPSHAGPLKETDLPYYLCPVSPPRWPATSGRSKRTGTEGSSSIHRTGPNATSHLTYGTHTPWPAQLRAGLARVRTP